MDHMSPLDHVAMPRCVICLEPCILPVEMICFPCHPHAEKPTCFSFQRICELCAILYLELDKRASERTTKRCLFCETYCHPKDLSIRTSFRKDYLLIHLDDRPTIQCPNAECSYIDSHPKVNVHFMVHCMYTPSTCACGEVGTREFIQNHHQRYNCVFYRPCTECTTIVSIFLYEDHLRQNHNMILCPVCKQSSSSTLRHHLEQECPLRCITCQYCTKTFQGDTILEHWLSHMKESRKRIFCMKLILEREQQTLEDLMRTCEQLHPSFTTTTTTPTVQPLTPASASFHQENVFHVQSPPSHTPPPPSPPTPPFIISSIPPSSSSSSITSLTEPLLHDSLSMSTPPTSSDDIPLPPFFSYGPRPVHPPILSSSTSRLPSPSHEPEPDFPPV